MFGLQSRGCGGERVKRERGEWRRPVTGRYCGVPFDARARDQAGVLHVVVHSDDFPEPEPRRVDGPVGLG